MRLSMSEVARATQGLLAGPPDLVTNGVSTDSRGMKAGDLFVALTGEHLDGHDFVRDAFLTGAAAAMVEHEIRGAGPQIVVDNCSDALGRLAGFVRDLVDPIVVGITGSVGKTSTKDFLASICSRKLETVASPLSYNAEVGLPVTLLSMKRQTEVVVCEMGSRGLGQIRSLCDIARPHIGVVTNVGLAHYEQFGSPEAIRNAKAELVESLPEGGSAVLNADDLFVAQMKDRTSAAVITFGISKTAHIRGEQIRMDDMGRPTFRIARDFEGVWVTLPVSGRHQVMNGLGACGAGVALGLSLDECRAGLESATASPWRMEVHSENDLVVVNDAYNANPDSVTSALETSRGMVREGGRLIAVLGYMAELGQMERDEHLRIGELAASLADKLIVVSSRASGIADGAARGGMAADVVDDTVGALERLDDLRAGDVVLVKASRVAALETLADQILDRTGR